MKLRPMEPEDVPTVVDMGRDMIAESSFSSMEFDAEKVTQFVSNCQFAVVAVLGEEIVGGIIGDVVEPWYSRDLMGVEHVLYVAPKWRGTPAAVMLIRAWANWCKQMGAKQIRPATAATSLAADRLYSTLGFAKAGSLYLMEV